MAEAQQRDHRFALFYFIDTWLSIQIILVFPFFPYIQNPQDTCTYQGTEKDSQHTEINYRLHLSAEVKDKMAEHGCLQGTVFLNQSAQDQTH